MPSGEEVRKIVSAGILAPSGDNCQPWKLYFDGERLHVLIALGRDTSLYNVGEIASCIAIGAMVENMDIAARGLGYSLSVSAFPNGERSPLVANIGFVKGEAVDDPLLPAIPQRCVNRRPYHRKPLSSSHRDALTSVVIGQEDAKLCLVESGKDKTRLSSILALNDRIVFENEKLHDFLFTHLRWTKEEIESSGDGMSIDSLELGAFQSRMMKLLSSWKLVRFLNRFGFSRFVPMQAYQLCKGASALGILSHSGTGLTSYFLGGRVLQRIWLTATSLGVSFHPMTGIVYMIRYAQIDGREMNPAHKTMLENSFVALREICPLGKDESYIMAFRLGYADPPSDRSRRMPLESVLVFGSPPR